MAFTILLSLGIYFLTTLSIGLASRRKSENSILSYFLADRKVSCLHLSLTMFATWFSTFAFLGAPGFFYRKGISWLLICGSFLMLAPIVGWFLGRKVWYLGKRNAYITPGDLLADVYQNSRIRFYTAVICVLALIPYSLIQFIGIGKVISTCSQHAISYEIAVVITMMATALYLFWGGIRAIVLTDVLQGSLFLSVMILAAYVVVDTAGGIAEGFTAANQLKPELFELTSEDIGPSISLMIVWGCGFMVLPHLWQRFYMAESAKTLVQSNVVFLSLSTVLLVMMALAGLLSIPLFETLTDSDNLIPQVFLNYFPQGMTLLVVATFAAGMSTIDSQVLTSASIIIIDIISPLIKTALSAEAETWLSKLLSILLVFIVGLLALSPASQSALVPLASKGTLIAFLLFIPLVCATTFESVGSFAVELCILLGFGLLCFLELGAIEQFLPWNLGTAPSILLAQGFVCFCGAYCSKFKLTKSNDDVAEFFSRLRLREI